MTKLRNAIIIVLYFLSALRVINGTCCYIVGTRTEAEFMNVQFRRHNLEFSDLRFPYTSHLQTTFAQWGGGEVKFISRGDCE
jgi:hypothetical protein